MVFQENLVTLCQYLLVSFTISVTCEISVVTVHPLEEGLRLWVV